MTNRSTKSIKVMLTTPVDGLEIEMFIQERRLRAGGILIYGATEEGAFLRGKLYTGILIGSNSPVFGKSSARELADRFNGELVY